MSEKILSNQQVKLAKKKKRERGKNWFQRWNDVEVSHSIKYHEQMR